MSAGNKIEIIPAIDIIGGRCVRLSQGDYSQKTVYDDSPLEMAMRFEEAGIRRLHLVDLDGAREGRVLNQAILESIAGRTRLVIDFGGGIKTDADIESVFNAGAAIATIGSVAVKNENLFLRWLDLYGPSRILTGADVRGKKIAVGGWKETTELSVFEFLETRMAKDLRQVFCTDIAKDGILEGPSLDLYTEIRESFPGLELIASGGVSGLEDLVKLESIGCAGVIIGKALYEGRISLNELKSFL